MRINEAYNLLRAVYIDWSHALANPRGIRKDSQITWDNYIPQMLKQPIKTSDIIDLSDKGQYTFQVIEDGSLIQIYYQYDSKGNELQSARLAFYSSVTYENEKTTELSPDLQPYPGTEANDFDSFDRDIFAEEYNKEVVDETQLTALRDGSIGWLRIDYDPEHANGVLHHHCHMPLSTFPRSRLIVAGVPTPRQFIEFIMALCYPRVYEKHRLNKDGQYNNEKHILTINSNCVPLREYDVFRQMTHFRIPIISEGRGR